MIDKMCAFQNSGTWELVFLPPSKLVVGCQWICTVKVGLDGAIGCLKAYLVAKGYTHIFCLDYGDTFFLFAKIASIQLFLSMAAMCPLATLSIGHQ